jgi:hypothetical protein
MAGVRQKATIRADIRPRNIVFENTLIPPFSWNEHYGDRIVPHVPVSTE